MARFHFCPRIESATDSLSHPMGKVLQAKRWGAVTRDRWVLPGITRLDLFKH